MRSFTCVYAHMPVQFSGMFECSRANFAFVGSFFGVNASVDAEVLFDTEAFVTELTSGKNINVATKLI